jgi:hypothetical protein
MSEHDDLERRLSALGEAPTPAPSPDLLMRLRGSALRRPAANRRLVRMPILLPAAAVAALVLGAVLLVGGRDASSPETIVVQTASDAVVEEAGEVVDVRAGQTLPEGAEIRTGPEGSVSVDGITLGRAERAVVRDGRLRRIGRRQEIEAAPVRLGLDVRRGLGGQVAVRWSRYEGDDFTAYVLFADGRVVTARRNVDRTVAFRRLRAGRTSRFVIVVMDSQRHVIARSPVVNG